LAGDALVTLISAVIHSEDCIVSLL